MRVFPYLAVFSPSLGISAILSSIFWERVVSGFVKLPFFGGEGGGRPDSEHYSFHYLVPPLKWDIS